MTHPNLTDQVNRGAIFAFLFTFSCLNSYAQLNESDTSRIQINAGINGIRQTGNVDLGILRSRLELVAKLSDTFFFKSQNNSLFQEFSGFKADNDINSRNYLYYHPEKRMYPFAMVYMQSNFRLKIQQRFFYGAGATIQLIKKENHSFKTSVSIVDEKTRYRVNEFNEAFYSGLNAIEIVRPTLYLAGNHQFDHQKIQFHYTVYWQPGIAHVSNQRFQAEAGIAFNIWEGLSVNLQYLTISEEVVPINVKQNDAMFTVGVNYQLKKRNKLER